MSQKTRRTVALGILALIGAVTIKGVADIERDLTLIKQLGERETATPPKLSEQAIEARKLDEALAGARTIDEYLEAKWREKKIAPRPYVDDDIFVRRAYLDIAGRIPSLSEVLEFRKSTDQRKRQKLIDKLLDSEAYVSDMYNFWADVLRVQSDMRGDGTQYAAWIKKQLADNTPYNKIVYELVTAEGHTWENGAAGYYLRDDGMPLDNMANTVQIFLGTSLVCAQCHDHPFDKWTQYEFFEMAAYTSGVQTRVNPANLREAYGMIGGDDAARRALDDLARELTYGVTYSPEPLRLPGDYKYDDAKPNELVKPFTIFGGEATAEGSVSLRESYAAWMTSPDNPRFTHVIANRLWKKVFGIALVEPVDMWTDDSVAYDPALLDYLAHKMRSFNYDQKQFLRMLYNSRLYQREVVPTEPPEDTAEWHFTGPVLTRISAEQFWDSLMTLTIPDVDDRKGVGSYDMYGYGAGAALAKMKPMELVQAARELGAYNQRVTALNERISAAREAKNQDEVRRLVEERNRLPRPNVGGMMMMEGENDKPRIDDSRWKGYAANLRRASELRSPEGFGHFLRLFGQSDRDVVDNANREAHILQVLTAFNGPEFRAVMADNSVLMQNVDKVSTDADKVSVIFMSILGRTPTSNEMKISLDALRGTGHGKYERVVWALLNTREFSFRQ